MAGVAGLEPVTSAVTGQRSNQLSYTPAKGNVKIKKVSAAVKVCFGLFHRRFEPAAEKRAASVLELENPGSRRQGGGGGEPR